MQDGAVGQVRLAIEVSPRACLPEVRAYQEYFVGHGFSVSLVEQGAYRPGQVDAVLLFHGFHPFWRNYPRIVISEYHSLTVGKGGYLKDWLKRLLNVRGDLWVFLNDDVRKRLLIGDGPRVHYRPMGFYGDLVESAAASGKDFDLVYSGSMRPGLSETIRRLAEQGYSVAVAGSDGTFEHPNVTWFGKVDVDASYRLMARSRVGLNYVPDEYPLNVQDSTKVIEYCALGLGVLSNRYYWVEKFESERNARFMYLEDKGNAAGLREFEFFVPDVSDLEWSKIMEKSGLARSLLGII